MTKPRSAFICQNCGYAASKWLGRCPDCGEWNSIVEELVHPLGAKKPGGTLGGSSAATPFHEVSSQEYTRFSSGLPEFDRVLGGGIVPGSLVLLGGDPGIGKSTLLLQAAEFMQRHGRRLLYVSGEESERQIKMRGDRLGIQPSHLFLLTETCLERILETVDQLQPEVIVLDSVQTVFSEKLGSAPGSISQVREVATQFLLLSKQRSIPAFLVGHITKDGALAGPKSLEHIVDTVLYFEGERYHSHRIVRTVKNRFGAANELGVFEMTSEGLIPVDNPSKLFLSERPAGASGSVVIGCVEGSRPILVELQALVSGANYASPRRMAAGVDPNRVSLLLAMLDKRLGMQLGGSDVYVNVAGGLTVDEPAADLGIVASIVSSYRNRAVAQDRVIFGEVGLAGEVRATSQTPLRIREAASMGFRQCILPHNSLPRQEQQPEIELIPVRTVQESMEVLFD
ncbi:MAG: DNA repair protein RadA [Acidimicrobiia bacterium]|nr:DNA repair protein RadA [Acidimicrobiia bacterium]